MSSLVKSKSFIDGQWVPAASGKTFEVKNPKNGAVIGTVPDMDREDTNRAIDAASKACANSTIHILSEKHMNIFFCHLGF